VYRLAYNTNGLAHHRVLDSLELLAELGYEGVAITPDVGQLDPYRLAKREVSEVRARAEELGLELAIETGARFVMDSARKHFPTLLEEAQMARARRIDFLKRCIDLGCELGAGVVSIWSGQAPGGVVAEDETDAAHAERERMWSRLCEGLGEVLAYATEAEIQIAFEPEPGMFI
jgi:sugar phosphate isomerase/epimerase